MGADPHHSSPHPSSKDKVGSNGRPADDPKSRRRPAQQQQARQGKTPQMGSDAHPYLPPIPRKYPEPTD